MRDDHGPSEKEIKEAISVLTRARTIRYVGLPAGELPPDESDSDAIALARYYWKRGYQEGCDEMRAECAVAEPRRPRRRR